VRQVVEVVEVVQVVEGSNLVLCRVGIPMVAMVSVRRTSDLDASCSIMFLEALRRGRIVALEVVVVGGLVVGRARGSRRDRGWL